MTITGDDLMTYARTVWGEARGEGHLGMLAVAHVIRTRAEDPGPDWWGNTIAEVCLKPWQFSARNPNDPNYAKLQTIGLDDPYLQMALRCCLEATLSPRSADPSGGADHYHVRSMNPFPKWAVGRAPDASIGAHLFYKLGSGN